MCRFVAFLGAQPLLLRTLLEDAPHSLIKQSHSAKETESGINADGFGVGWYDRGVDDEPAIYRSVLPAWNDENLINISSKVKSACFLGHIRESTYGVVSNGNCHPFSHEHMLFAHNGTIFNFEKIKKDLLCSLSQQFFNQVRGQTDSEHFFLQMLDNFKNGSMLDAFISTVQRVNNLLLEQQVKPDYRLNTVFTNGKEMMATRYIASDRHSPHSLYYAEMYSGVVVASEKLTDEVSQWIEVPANSALFVNEGLEISIQPIEV